MKSLRYSAPIVIMLALWLAACGSTPTTVAGGNAAPTVTAAPSTTALANGCPTQHIPVEPPPPAQVKVTPSGTKAAPVMLNVGESLEVRMSSTIRWQLNLADPNQILGTAAPEGWYNKSLTACIWRYSATKVGNATFMFTGTVLCQPGQACPHVAIETDFDITVK